MREFAHVGLTAARGFRIVTVGVQRSGFGHQSRDDALLRPWIERFGEVAGSRLVIRHCLYLSNRKAFSKVLKNLAGEFLEKWPAACPTVVSA